MRVPSSFASDGKIRLLILHGNLFYTKIGNITDDPLQPNLLLLPKYLSLKINSLGCQKLEAVLCQRIIPWLIYGAMGRNAES